MARDIYCVGKQVEEERKVTPRWAKKKQKMTRLSFISVGFHIFLYVKKKEVQGPWRLRLRDHQRVTQQALASGQNGSNVLKTSSFLPLYNLILFSFSVEMVVSLCVSFNQSQSSPIPK